VVVVAAAAAAPNEDFDNVVVAEELATSLVRAMDFELVVVVDL
jgi:hypothetical protein